MQANNSFVLKKNSLETNYVLVDEGLEISYYGTKKFVKDNFNK